MTTKVVPGQLIAAPDSAQVAREAAARIARVLRAALARSGRASIALSGGNTPRDTYALLAQDTAVDWTKVHIFWVDERAVPPTDDRSNYRWAKATLVDRAKIPEAHVHRMRADEADLDKAAREYEEVLRTGVPVGQGGVPSFDVMVLGV